LHPRAMHVPGVGGVATSPTGHPLTRCTCIEGWLGGKRWRGLTLPGLMDRLTHGTWTSGRASCTRRAPRRGRDCSDWEETCTLGSASARGGHSTSILSLADGCGQLAREPEGWGEAAPFSSLARKLSMISATLMRVSSDTGRMPGAMPKRPPPRPLPRPPPSPRFPGQSRDIWPSWPQL